MLLRPANVLLLDEPTNHLDLDAREVLEGALEDWEGTMIFISHDRYFINRIANKVVEVKGGHLREFLGNYDYYLEKVEEEEGEQREILSTEAASRRAARKQGTLSEPIPTAGRRKSKEEKRREADERQRRSARLSPLKERLAEVEREIHSTESRLQEVMGMLSQPSLYREGEKIREVMGEKESIEDQIRVLYQEWEEVSLVIEEIVRAEE
jgi:ATP-binding cassette subfamily F protein 3